MAATSNPPKTGLLSFWVKLAYGTGDWSEASYGTLRQIFYAIFLTDVVGLEPRLGVRGCPGGHYLGRGQRPAWSAFSPTACAAAGGAGAHSCCSSRSPSGPVSYCSGGRRPGTARSPWLPRSPWRS